ncbi:hypothetical protein FV218_18885 [Methylobacterium sp. WL69]|jgi:hypothetical protein|uniref:hypothetical protein n=1 Tax=Methylobacterium sp. WL69 TaxID=2603893 RepID=UPI0011CA55EF|nr:hypothetical protein [Methylobacterium sp. WL69]TXM67847.1 hypothetical protein FV218_18885 [Methylobacterium sp. WL69]
MHASVLLALVSIPFAMIFLSTPGHGTDLFTILYITALGLTFSAILLAGGHQVFPFLAVFVDPAHR